MSVNIVAVETQRTGSVLPQMQLQPANSLI